MVHPIVVRWRFVVNDQEHPKSENHGRCGNHPTEFDEESRMSSSHGFNVFAQSPCAIEPCDGYYFEKRKIHDGDGCSVMVNQLEEVYSTLQKENFDEFLSGARFQLF